MVRIFTAYILGLFIAAVSAVALYPRAAWVELLDHYQFNMGHHRFSESHQQGYALVSQVLDPHPYFFSYSPKRDAFEEPNKNDILLLAGNPVFSLTWEKIERVCMEVTFEGSWRDRRSEGYGFWLKEEALAEFLSALADYENGEAFSDALHAVGFGFPQYNIYYSNKVLRDDLIYYTKEYGQAHYSLQFTEPFLELGQAIAKALNGDKPIPSCEAEMNILDRRSS